LITTSYSSKSQVKIKPKLTGNFQEAYTLLVKEKPELKHEIAESVKLFCKNSNDTRLGNHPLRGRMKGKWAFSVTDDVRVIYERRGKNIVRFLTIGFHHEVYRRN
jgi:addiction module RelE/StbE family toxin